MNPPDTNDPLDALLHEQNNYIEDNGFTARVVSALPTARRRTWLRPAILLGATALGYVLAIFWMPWKEILSSLTTHTLNSQTLLCCVVLVTTTGSLVWGMIAAIEES